MTKLSPNRVFIIIGLIFGLIFVFITPPFQVPDEYAHFYRAYQVSDGGLISEKNDNRIGGMLPESLQTIMPPYIKLQRNSENKQQFKNISAALDLPLNPKNQTFYGFANTALYSPIPYLTQSIGINIGKFLNLSPLILLYLGRISNLIIWIVIISFAIKITQICKWLFVILALTPMSLFLASSLSPDCLTNALSFLTISIFLYYSLGKKEVIKQGDLYIIFISTLLCTLSKNAYLTILVLYLLIPIKKIGSSKKYFSLFLLLILLNVIALAGWFILVNNLYKPLIQGVLPNKQLEFIFYNLIKYLYIVIESYWIHGRGFINSCIGILGWLDTPMPIFYYDLAIAMLFFFAFFDSNNQVNLRISQRLVLLVCVIGTLFIIATMMYMSWTPVGQEVIEGIQGRYFIPISPLIFLVFYNRKFHFKEGYLNIIGSFWVVFSLVLASFILINRYYL
jgi:uncharacterized membrane protein